ncbi:PAS domain-containing hybrid sensor histidine kinase/response regulator [Pseudoalteromonas sp. S16_S37]|uniref:PAS domain-containing hybrid sensor histidine kinase/response regulator n=1 Tax=Pseudoalteromonas sp. S16_S37 TaxID=2720228 RepID=UPI0016810890|nr:PAS domain-containing hybrid sensor histidine kinase/response regulator [Pseudoalteromonas sp. S16_S37]MBD1584177.1 PAS domain S-box protein [Pseudoalteromonas sp. S16_S37]
MKWLESIPYPYVIACLTTVLLSSLFIVVQDSPSTQIQSSNQAPTNAQMQLISQELTQFNQLVDTTDNDPKKTFAIWKASRANLSHNSLSEYFIHQNTLTIAASDNQDDIGKALPNTIESTHFLSSVKGSTPYIHQDEYHLFGAISLCVSSADCYYYLQIRNLPSNVITQSNFIYIGNWVLIGLALILLNIAYLKFRMRTLKSVLATHFEQTPGFSLISIRDDITLLTQSIVNKAAASDAPQSDNSEHMDNLSAQLQSQFSRLSAIINTVVDGIITIDNEGIVETFNPAAERIFGYKADQVIGQNVKMLMPSPYQNEHDSYIDNYLTTGEAKVIGLGREVLGQKADGALFPMELSVSEMSVDGQRMFTGIVRDISEIAEQKSLLNDQVARIKAIIETVIDGIITIDEKGIIDSFNPAAEKIFGYKEPEVVGKNIKMLMPAPYQQEHDQYLVNYITSGDKKVIGSGREVLGQRKDGAIFSMSLAVSEMNVNGQRMFTGIVRDISDIVEQKALLNDQVARIKAIIETVIDGIITINEKGIIDSFNPAAEKIFGYKEQEVIGKNIKMLMPAPYQQEHDQYLVNYMTSGIKKVIGSGREVLGQRKDGSVFSMSLAVSEMLVGDKRMFTGIVRDITEQKKYEAALTQYRLDLEEQVQQRTSELESATKQAQSASKAKSKFLSRMSHELRTPLNAIIGFTQLLEEEDLSESQIDSLKEISTAGKDLTLMVNEILQVASVQTGSLSLSIEEVLLNENLKESINQLLPAAHQKHISISFDESTQYYVKADYSKLKQVITNLIDNAIRYSDNNTQVTIALKKDRDSVCTHIKDTGSGISSEKLANIFEPFERGADEYSGEQGIGIGLTIAKEFIEAMDGQIDVHSSEGKGTTVTFTLPLARIEDVHQSNQHTVLYIEDNATNRKLMKRLISRFDNIVYHEAIDGISGIEAAKKLKPSLILLDINLPDISGYEVFEKLKQYESTKNIAVVGVSANAMSTDQDKARDLGFSDYLTKPIELDALTDLFECMFKKHTNS